MQVLRGRAGLLAVFALTWQIVALMLVPTAACCRPVPGAAMADCPMHHSNADESCPMHAQSASDHACECPRMNCSQGDGDLMALLGSIGVLPARGATPTLHRTGDAVPVMTPSSNSLAPVPAAPPPRA